MRQLSHEGPSAFNARRAPDHLLHALRGRHPRSASLAPTRRAGNGNFHPEAPRRCHRSLECILPLWRHVDQSIRNHLWRVDSAFKDGHAAQANPVHPLQIEIDSLDGNVSVHPVPPHTRPRAVGRVKESIEQRIGLRSGFRWRIGGSLRRNKTMQRACGANQNNKNRPATFHKDPL